MTQTETLFDQLIAFQENKLLELGRMWIPNLTLDDILQPNDYPELDNAPLFRYEEGVLKGLHTARMAFLAHIREGR